MLRLALTCPAMAIEPQTDVRACARTFLARMTRELEETARRADALRAKARGAAEKGIDRWIAIRPRALASLTAQGAAGSPASGSLPPAR